MDIKHISDALHVTESRLPRSSFDKVELTDAAFHHSRLSRSSFVEIEAKAARFSRCDLSDVSVESCRLDGMTIDGIRVSDLLAAYRRGA